MSSDEATLIVWRIVGSRYTVIEGVAGGSHFPFIESADAFNQAVADFLSD